MIGEVSWELLGVGTVLCILAERGILMYSLESRYDNPMPESTLSPQSGTMNLATLCSSSSHVRHPVHVMDLGPQSACVPIDVASLDPDPVWEPKAMRLTNSKIHLIPN